MAWPTCGGMTAMACSPGLRPDGQDALRPAELEDHSVRFAHEPAQLVPQRLPDVGFGPSRRGEEALVLLAGRDRQVAGASRLVLPQGTRRGWRTCRGRAGTARTGARCGRPPAPPARSSPSPGNRIPCTLARNPRRSARRRRLTVSVAGTGRRARGPLGVGPQRLPLGWHLSSGPRYGLHRRPPAVARRNSSTSVPYFVNRPPGLARGVS